MTHKDTWYRRVLGEKKKEIINSAIFAVLFAVIVSFWHFFMGKDFEWQSISPIEAPSFFHRLFYSALVFVTLGAMLYSVGFYKFLYSFFRGGGRRGYREYKRAKSGLWGMLMLIMFFIIIPMAVKMINAVIAFFYNIYVLFVHLAPPFAITVFFFGCMYYLRKKYFLKNEVK